jgi:serine/threonine protein kinase/WD40 repeat protein
LRRTDDPMLGAEVGGYRIVELIGEGGMSRVYRAILPSIGAQVAIKVLAHDMVGEAGMAERLVAEARLANVVRHDGLVNVHGLGVLPDGRPYLIMEYLFGEPLAAAIARSHRLPLGTLCSLICETLEAIAPMHDRGLVHRDLKPSNLFVTSAGRLKVIDFGIAKLTTNLGLTLTGQRLGTPTYMAPEQIRGDRVDARTDLYALGLVLFEGATGHRPFDVADQLAQDRPPPPSVIDLVPGAPHAIDAVIRKAVELDPARRFQTAVEMEQALHDVIDALPPDAFAAAEPPGVDLPRASATAATERWSVTGRKLGGFVVREQIGAGGFGMVYRAEQPILDREVVIKLLTSTRRTRPGFVERFFREARLASRLDHPYAAHVYGFGAEPDGLLWIAMEHVRGAPLAQLIAERPLAVGRLVPLIDGLCEVVQTAHDQGIHHRDIKPSNVMVIVRAGRLIPKLIDFGIATAVDAGEDEAETGLTGSPPYMAPECWRADGVVDHRADLYALGVLMFEALTGRLPFTGPTAIAIAHAHLHQPVPALGGELDAVLARAMAKRPEDRYGSALELAAALRVAAGLPSQALPQLDEAIRAPAIAQAARPIAEAVAAIESVATAAQIDAAITHTAGVVARWLGAIAVAVRTRTGSVAGDSARAGELLARIVVTTLAPAEWIELARELVAPFRGRVRTYPVPELVGAVDGAYTALRTLLAPAEERDDDTVASRIALLGSAIAAIRSLDDYALVVPRGATGEAWMGLRRIHARTIAMTSAVDGDQPVLVDREGVPVIALAPLVQVLRPSPEAAEELFFVEGAGRFGTRLVAPIGIQRRFERHDDRVAAWHRTHFGGSRVAALTPVAERAPYLGLAAFTRDDADLFFGREAEAEAFANRLRMSTFLAVVGPSGVGKSSFVQAGVLPRTPPGWRSAVVRPGPSPFAALRARLADEGIELDGDPLHDPGVLGRALAGAADRFVLAVDQFEELITLCNDPDERLAYAAALVAAGRDDKVAVVVTIRDDFLIRVQQLAPLRDRLALGLQLLGTPDAADLRRILLEPARRAGYDFDDPTLADEMVREVADRPGALALLSFTAEQLWVHRDRHFQRLTRVAYDSIGGVGGALAQHAERTLDAIGGDALAVREAFRHLVTADGTRATVPRPDLAELVARSGSTDVAAAERVLERLIAARLLMASEGDGGADLVEVIHEALLVSWPRLVRWQREDAESVRLRDQLRAAARQWDARDRPRGLLWRGDALLELRPWRARYSGALTAVEEDFVRSSVSDEATGRRVRRAIVAAAIVVLTAGVITLWELNRRAERSAAAAHRELIAGYVEQGRTELIAGNPQVASLYLDEALRDGSDSPALRFMLGRALDSVSLALAAVHAHAYSVRWLVQGGNGIVVTADDGARGTLRAWAGPGRSAWIAEVPSKITSLAAERDGDHLVVGCADGTVRIHRLSDGRATSERRAHAGPVRALAIAGDAAISGGADGVLVWSPLDGAVASQTTLAHDGGLRAIAIAGDAVVTGGEHGDVAVWDKSRALRWRASGHSSPVSALAVTPDGTTLLSASRDGAIAVWDLLDGTRRGALIGHDGAVLGIAISPDGRYAASASMDTTARLWSLRGMRKLHSIAHRGPVSAVAFTADGERVITSSTDAVVRAWDVVTGVPIARYQGHTAAVLAVAEARDGSAVLTAGVDGMVRWWRSGDRLHQRVWFAGAAGLHGVDWSPDGTRVAAAGGDGRIAMWDVAADRLLWQVDGHRGHAWSVRFSPDGAYLASSGADDGHVLVFSADGHRVADVTTGAPAAYELAFGDRDHLFVAQDDGVVSRIEIPSGRITPTTIRHAKAVRALDVRAGRIATGSDDRHARVAELATGRVLFDHVYTSEVYAVALSPDGAVVAFGGPEGRVQLYDVASGEPITSLDGHTSIIRSVAFTPDGQYVVTAGPDGTIRQWDRSGKLLFVIDAEAHPPDAPPEALPDGFARIGPDGASIASVGGDGRVRLWSVAPDDRSPAAIADLLDCWVPYALQDQRLVLRRPRCVTEDR